MCKNGGFQTNGYLLHQYTVMCHSMLIDFYLYTVSQKKTRDYIF